MRKCLCNAIAEVILDVPLCLLILLFAKPLIVNINFQRIRFFAVVLLIIVSTLKAKYKEKYKQKYLTRKVDKKYVFLENYFYRHNIY